MEKQISTKRMITILLCVCFIIVSFLSIIYFIEEAHHDCNDEYCQTCANIQSVKKVLKQLTHTRFGNTRINRIILHLIIGIPFIIYNTMKLTLVNLKIRMNN